MKSSLRYSAGLILGWLCLLFSVTAHASNIGVLFSNGPATPADTYAWDISTPGYVVSNSFTIPGAVVAGFSFGVWVPQGDIPLTVDWSITSAANGGTVYGYGTASGATLSRVVLPWTQNNPTLCGAAPCDVYQLTVSGLAVNMPAGTFWLNLSNAGTTGGGFVGWDQNNGINSSAVANYFGAIPSEDPDIYGYTTSGTVPEGGSLSLLSSGVLVLGSVLRRRLWA